MTESDRARPDRHVKRAGHLLGEKRGYHFPAFDWLADRDPDYEEARQKLMSLVYTPATPLLPIKYRELIASAVLATRAYPSIEPHLRRALREGASVNEVIEAMEVASVSGGLPTLHFALTYLSRIVQRP